MPGRVLRPSSPFVEVAEIALVEAKTAAELDDLISRVMQSELPGFVIRGTSPTQRLQVVGSNQPKIAAGSHQEVREAAVEVLESKSFKLAGSMHIARVALGQKQGEGDLHADSSSKGPVRKVNIHTTLHGAGSVILAESGPRFEDRDLTMDLGKSLHPLVLSSRTDPELLDPSLHVAHLAAGDHVVFSLANEKGPVWHRFDTSSTDERLAEVTCLDVVIN